MIEYVNFVFILWLFWDVHNLEKENEKLKNELFLKDFNRD